VNELDKKRDAVEDHMRVVEEGFQTTEYCTSAACAEISGEIERVSEEKQKVIASFQTLQDDLRMSDMCAGLNVDCSEEVMDIMKQQDSVKEYVSDMVDAFFVAEGCDYDDSACEEISEAKDKLERETEDIINHIQTLSTCTDTATLAEIQSQKIEMENEMSATLAKIVEAEMIVGTWCSSGSMGEVMVKVDTMMEAVKTAKSELEMEMSNVISAANTCDPTILSEEAQIILIKDETIQLLKDEVKDLNKENSNLRTENARIAILVAEIERLKQQAATTTAEPLTTSSPSPRPLSFTSVGKGGCGNYGQLKWKTLLRGNQYTAGDPLICAQACYSRRNNCARFYVRDSMCVLVQNGCTSGKGIFDIYEMN